MDIGLDITRADYKSGYCFLGFNKSPSLCRGDTQERKRHGTASEYKNLATIQKSLFELPNYKSNH